ncbi:hypothetical protein DHEL01_v203243 [Diaporthe helianthi]|uniref:Xylanolytic transcriptional activator regulatory domain-containing protein n=1 Tax=Diaporthe helianthi TaxID=158607 RepID=A0A2P5I759_DIAHE|nr:hypothetical protein DHEL01_v203243 [Diaporthe helianthi]
MQEAGDEMLGRKAAMRELRFNTLPPHSIVEALIDAYFVRVHNQPYAYFHEDRFRRNLEGGLLPKCLIFAVIASSLRFTDLDFYRGSTAEATTAYAREAWLSVLNDHMTTENSPSLHVAQTLNILAIIDFTSGRISSGWLKIGLAIRIAQDLQLMKEPSEELSSVEREEHRRVFWSIYLLDKLVSCGKSRTPAISDEDCHVQLPCDEDTFRKGEHKNTATLDDLHQWNAESISACGNFALALLVGSALGRCARYVLHERRRGEVPPWDSCSKMASINSFLLVVESHLKIDEQSIGDIIAANQLSSEDDGIDHQAIAHVIFARAIFHLCHILLNHPFLIRLHLPEQSDGAPPSFLSRAFRTGAEHARQLARFLVDAANAGCHVASSFYAYSIAVAGSVLILHSVGARNRTPHQRAELDEGVQHAIDTLDRMGMIWRHASKMKTRLQSFKQHAHIFASILDPHTSPKLDIDSELALWSMVDYGTMCSEDQLIMPAQSVSATNSESEEVPRSTSSATLAIDARGQQPGDFPLLTHITEMGNHNSRSSAVMVQRRQLAHNQLIDYFDFMGLPTEIQTMIVGWLCPNCAFGDGEIASTEEARELQRSLGNLAVCSSRLLKVANGHTFHSFVMPQDPAFSDRQTWIGDPERDADVGLAHRYHNRAFANLLERLLNYAQLREDLKFLSLRNFTLRFKAGITKGRLRLFINSSRSLGLPVPAFIPELLGNLPSVSTLGIPEPNGDFVFARGRLLHRMEMILESFPNLRAFQNDDGRLEAYPNRLIRAPDTPPLGQHLRRLVLSSEQPGRLRNVTRMLREFPNLEEFYFHRRRAHSYGARTWNFSNANVFDALHHSLRVLKYTSAWVTLHPHPDDFRIEIDCFEERNNSDVPHLAAFTKLERLDIDQALLGRMATVRDQLAAPIGPHFPGLDWKLPQSLRRLTIRYVHDWAALAAQLIPLAVAKRAGGQFPFLESIYIVIAPVGIVSYTGTWPLEMSLNTSQLEVVRSTGLLLRDVGIQLWVSTEDIGPRPPELDDYLDGAETLIAINFQVFNFYPI